MVVLGNRESETVIKGKQVYNDKNTNDVSTSIDNLIDNVKKADKDEYKHFYDLPYAREVSEKYGLLTIFARYNHLHMIMMSKMLINLVVTFKLTFISVIICIKVDNKSINFIFCTKLSK